MDQNATGPCATCEEGGKCGAKHDTCIRYNAWKLTWEGVKQKSREVDVYQDYMNKKMGKSLRESSKKHHQRKKGY